MNKRVVKFEISEPPPSVNAMTAVVNGRKIKTAKGKAWAADAADELKGQTALTANPSYWRADILIPASKTKCDLDNLLKGILDALGADGKTPDDRYLVDLRVRFHGGESVIIETNIEDLSKWAEIMKTTDYTIKKMAWVDQLPD